MKVGMFEQTRSTVLEQTVFCLPAPGSSYRLLHPFEFRADALVRKVCNCSRHVTRRQRLSCQTPRALLMRGPGKVGLEPLGLFGV